MRSIFTPAVIFWEEDLSPDGLGENFKVEAAEEEI
jgi:hypothetical protein